MKSTERSNDLSELCQALQRFISEAVKNENPSQPLAIYVEQLKSILRKHTDVGRGKQYENIR